MSGGKILIEFTWRAAQAVQSLRTHRGPCVRWRIAQSCPLGSSQIKYIYLVRPQRGGWLHRRPRVARSGNGAHSRQSLHLAVLRSAASTTRGTAKEFANYGKRFGAGQPAIHPIPGAEPSLLPFLNLRTRRAWSNIISSSSWSDGNGVPTDGGGPEFELRLGAYPLHLLDSCDSCRDD
jgi:hypothetical protein